MKAIEQLAKRLAPYGVTFDIGDSDFYIDAPSGYEWASNGCTVIAVQFRNVAGQSWLMKALKECKGDWDMGLDLVTDPAAIAEYRHLKDDDTWGAPEGSPAHIEIS